MSFIWRLINVMPPSLTRPNLISAEKFSLRLERRTSSEIEVLGCDKEVAFCRGLGYKVGRGRVQALG